MQFIDLKSQQQRIRDKIESRIRKVLDHGQYIMGPEIDEIEADLGRFAQTKHAVSCGSGTDALLMALMAYGIGPGDAVFTPAFTFVATAEVIALLGATPVFVDIDSRTFNMDTEQLEKAVTALKTGDSSLHPLPAGQDVGSLTARGIVTVNLFGLPADYDAINRIAKAHELFVVEDAAQSFGALYKERRSCSLADIGCTSFFPAKPLGCYGDGGMCFTNNDTLADRMRSIRIHGTGRDRYDNVRIGINGRMDTLQAAILLCKFAVYREEITMRQTVAMRYTQYFRSMGNIIPPIVPDNHLSVWAQYSILLPDADARSRAMERLRQKDIPTGIYYPIPLHLQTAFKYLNYEKESLPVSEDCARRILSLPMHPYLGDMDQETIVGAIGSI